MNKLVASVGLAALGAASVQAQTPGVTANMTKPWSVAVTLRGFYDDNLNTVPRREIVEVINGETVTNKTKDIFGVEVSPSLRWQWASPQTHLSLGYVYTFKGYNH